MITPPGASIGYMHRGSRPVIALMAVLLLFSSAQCMMACVSVPCHAASAGHAPCHHHRDSSRTSIPACGHALAVTAAHPAAFELAVAQITAPDCAVVCAVPRISRIDIKFQHTSPPTATALALRI